NQMPDAQTLMGIGDGLDLCLQLALLNGILSSTQFRLRINLTEASLGIAIDLTQLLGQATSNVQHRNTTRDQLIDVRAKVDGRDHHGLDYDQGSSIRHEVLDDLLTFHHVAVGFQTEYTSE